MTWTQAAAVGEILSLIEKARKAGLVGDDQARVASVALDLEGNDALLACRLIAQGADPASLDYLDTGEIAPKVMDAHRGTVTLTHPPRGGAYFELYLPLG